MTPYLLVGRGFKSEVAIRQGDAEGGVEGLQTSLQKLHAAPYELLTTPLNLSLVRGLSAIGQVDEATALIDESLGLVEKNGDQLYLPELPRMKGSLLLQSQRNRDEAAAYLMQALELSRSQRARAWELRTAIDMTTLMAGRGEITSARELLQPVAAHFVEGLNTADVKAAEHLLATLR
jgi:tetratricopeptide (TPR) repeat protein